MDIDASRTRVPPRLAAAWARGGYGACVVAAALVTHAVLIHMGGRGWDVDGPWPFLAGCALSAPLWGIAAPRAEAWRVRALKMAAAPPITAVVVFMLVPIGFAVGVYGDAPG
ncbi:MAG: hypothetical protein KDC33_09830 [Thermoleophilia bacterium]|nr:hypothetical protein [Thermoleophilia bacterium]